MGWDEQWDRELDGGGVHVYIGFWLGSWLFWYLNFDAADFCIAGRSERGGNLGREMSIGEVPKMGNRYRNGRSRAISENTWGEDYISPECDLPLLTRNFFKIAQWFISWIPYGSLTLPLKSILSVESYSLQPSTYLMSNRNAVFSPIPNKSPIFCFTLCSESFTPFNHNEKYSTSSHADECGGNEAVLGSHGVDPGRDSVLLIY